MMLRLVARPLMMEVGKPGGRLLLPGIRYGEEAMEI